MFRLSATILSALTMFLHAGLGCCWHHEHACAQHADRAAHDEHAADTHKHAHHAADSHHAEHHAAGTTAACEHASETPPGDRHDGGDHPQSPCEEGTCSFVITPVVKLFHERPPASQAAADAVPLFGGLLPVVRDGAVLVGLPPAIDSPQHLRLRTEVWLI